MKEPAWLTREVILATHEELLALFGGLSGIRDDGLLRSALARPQQLLAYENADIFRLATAYSYGIVKNHPFIDGNKRTGFMAAYIFLEINGEKFAATEEEVVIETMALAAGKRTEEQYAVWLEKSCR